MKENEHIKLFGYDPQSHPEKLSDETFVGNYRADVQYHIDNFDGARLGKQAFNIRGELLSKDFCVPIFIKNDRLAAYNRMMGERFSDAKLGITASYVKMYGKNPSII
jgi:hypothetical protein